MAATSEKLVLYSRLLKTLSRREEREHMIIVDRGNYVEDFSPRWEFV